MTAGTAITIVVVFTLLGMWIIAAQKNKSGQGQMQNFIKYWRRKVTTEAWAFPATIIFVAVITAICVGG